MSANILAQRFQRLHPACKWGIALSFVCRQVQQEASPHRCSMDQVALRRTRMTIDFWKAADQLVTWRVTFSRWQILFDIRQKGKCIKIRSICSKGHQIMVAWRNLVSKDHIRLRRKVWGRWRNTWPVIMGKLLLMCIRLWANRPQPMYLMYVWKVWMGLRQFALKVQARMYAWRSWIYALVWLATCHTAFFKIAPGARCWVFIYSVDLPILASWTDRMPMDRFHGHVPK